MMAVKCVDNDALAYYLKSQGFKRVDKSGITFSSLVLDKITFFYTNHYIDQEHGIYEIIGVKSGPNWELSHSKINNNLGEARPLNKEQQS